MSFTGPVRRNHELHRHFAECTIGAVFPNKSTALFGFRHNFIVVFLDFLLRELFPQEFVDVDEACK